MGSRNLGLGLAALSVVALLPVAGWAQSAPEVLPRPIQEIVAPLSGTPSIQLRSEPLVVELDADRAVDLGSLAGIVRPSFGLDRPAVELGTPVSTDADVASKLWPGRTVDRAVFELPDDPLLVPDLYDLELNWDGGSDEERRALQVVEEHAAAPRIAVIADPSVWDPRPVQDGANEALEGDPDSLFEKFTGTFGDIVNEPRWAALNRAINEINLVQPDFVLVTGDLTFAVHPNSAPLEYADAWAILDRLEVPAFVTPGNHDLYALDDYTEFEDLEYVDGWAAWREWFGPHYWATDIGPDFHLVSINTFDWQNLVPFPPPEFPTLSGGNLGEGQWAWLSETLLRHADRGPDQHLVTFAHHDPSMFGNRHNWPGAYRYETRDLFDAAGVDAHFSGHTHEDRVARYFEGGTVQTSGRPHMGHPVGVLSHVMADGDQLDEETTQQELGTILHEPAHGPLFVTTTTAASGLVGEDWGLGSYWGWRLSTLQRQPDGGYDPATFGYPMTAELLAERAAVPENWNADLAEYGVFSYPLYDLDLVGMEGSDGTAAFATATIDSQLLTDVEVTLRVVVAGVPPNSLAAEGGTILHARTVGDVTTVWVRGIVPRGGQHIIDVRAGSAGDAGSGLADGADGVEGEDTATPVTGSGHLVLLVGAALLALGVLLGRGLDGSGSIPVDGNQRPR